MAGFRKQENLHHVISHVDNLNLWIMSVVSAWLLLFLVVSPMQMPRPNSRLAGLDAERLSDLPRI